MGESYSESRGVTNSTRRYWRRVETPTEGWWPWGWLPLLGLLLAFLYGLLVTAPNMEQDIEQRVGQALADANFVGFDVKADGQHVLVSGQGSESVIPQITSIARGSVCDTRLAKNVICPTRVKVKLDAPPQAVASQAPAPAPVQEPTSRFHDFSISTTDAGVRLLGEVPNAEFKELLVEGAKIRFGLVVDDLRITNEEAGPDINWAATQSLTVLAELESGRTTWREGVFSVSGDIESQKEAATRKLFNSTANQSLLGTLDLRVLQTVNVCDERFAAALSQATIRFATSSADIALESLPLIEQLAEVAKECLFQLDVEGHTDSRGAADMNQALSLARAQAVVNSLGAMGVETTLLTARGYGPDRPIGDNQTRAGRAKNRRIVIKSAAANQP